MKKALPDLEIKYHAGAYLSIEHSPQVKACLINNVHPGSPADNVGLTPGDEIIEFDGKTIEDFDSFIKEMLSKEPGDEVEIKVIRNVGSFKVKAIFGKMRPFPAVTEIKRE